MVFQTPDICDDYNAVIKSMVVMSNYAVNSVDISVDGVLVGVSDGGVCGVDGVVVDIVVVDVVVIGVDGGADGVVVDVVVDDVVVVDGIDHREGCKSDD